MWYDLVVIGGGIHGCGCAAEAALRGLSVLLCEQDDLASKTSSNSSKLIHGGLRYLEHYDFSMVKKAMHEQHLLLQRAPHLVRPMPFVLPQGPHSRSRWLLRAGLFLYDQLRSRHTLPNSQWVTRTTSPAYFEPLASSYQQGYCYYDCATNDARLTLANALLAKNHDATILTQTTFTHASVVDNTWRLTLKPHAGDPFHINARAVINASGPWAERVSHHLGVAPQYRLTLVKGSHLLLPKWYHGEHAYVLQQDDARIVFVMPYYGHTLLGTTEVTIADPLAPIHIDTQEMDYLCDVAQRAFHRTIQPQDVRHTFSGVRGLVTHQNTHVSALSRDHVVEHIIEPAPLLNLFGGKLTTYRALAQQAIDALGQHFPMLAPSSSAHTPLPGAPLSMTAYAMATQQRYTWLDQATLARYLSTYGTLTDRILQDANNLEDLGPCLAPTVYQRELDYLQEEEWAKTADDVLWRRTQLGITLSTQDQDAIRDAWG